MKLIIEIPDKYYENDNLIHFFGVYSGKLDDVIKNGIPLEKYGRCRTCQNGEIYNDLWCRCHHLVIKGAMVKISDKCDAEEVIEINKKYFREQNIGANKEKTYKERKDDKPTNT